MVIGAGSDTPVEIQMGPHDLIITGARPSEVVFYLNDGYVHLKDSRQRDLIQRWNYYPNCKNLISKHSSQATRTPRSRMVENTEIIFDCPRYVNSKFREYRDFTPYSVSYDSLTGNKLKLNCPYNKEDVIILVTSGPVIGWNSIQVMLTPDPWHGYTTTRYYHS